MEAVHGVTIEEVHNALRRNDGNAVRAEQQLKVYVVSDGVEDRRQRELRSGAQTISADLYLPWYFATGLSPGQTCSDRIANR